MVRDYQSRCPGGQPRSENTSPCSNMRGPSPSSNVFPVRGGRCLNLGDYRGAPMQATGEHVVQQPRPSADIGRIKHPCGNTGV